MSFNRLLFGPLLAVAFATSSFAAVCACCVEPGYYEISTSRPSTYDLGVLADMKFATAADIYTSIAEFDDIKGLDDLRADHEAGRSIELNVVETFAGKTWRMAFKTGNGREGSLVLPMPPTMVKFKVDQHDNESGTETGLYKEFRFKGIVASGTGFFRRGILKPTSYFLVFQGRGNGCDSSSDFTHWRLELDGRGAEYAFFGKLN
jgi:hypothetical protein